MNMSLHLRWFNARYFLFSSIIIYFELWLQPNAITQSWLSAGHAWCFEVLMPASLLFVTFIFVIFIFSHYYYLNYTWLRATTIWRAPTIIYVTNAAILEISLTTIDIMKLLRCARRRTKGVLYILLAIFISFDISHDIEIRALAAFHFRAAAYFDAAAFIMMPHTSAKYHYYWNWWMEFAHTGPINLYHYSQNTENFLPATWLLHICA